MLNFVKESIKMRGNTPGNIVVSIMKKKLSKRTMTIYEAIIEQKKMASVIGSYEKMHQIDGGLKCAYSCLGTDIIMALMEFKCEKCENDEDITIHHLITRDNRLFVNPVRYFVQRHYFANMGILCIKHHSNFHGNDNLENPTLSLSKARIDKVKKRFGI